MIPQCLNQNADIDQQHKVLIEELEIHILALSSSSVDQAALLSDWLQWIQQTELTTSSNITITDNKLVFFSADKLAAHFERRTQTGRHYPCGSCGVHDSVQMIMSTALSATGDLYRNYSLQQ